MPHLSYACAHDLKAEPRANQLYGTPNMVHLCTGFAALLNTDGCSVQVVPCECACHVHTEEVRV